MGNERHGLSTGMEQMTLGDKVFTSNALVTCLSSQNTPQCFNSCLVHADVCILKILRTGITSVGLEMQIQDLLTIHVYAEQHIFRSNASSNLKGWMYD